MKHIKAILTLIALLVILNSFGQKSTIDLTFTAVNNTDYIPLDSIKVMNRSQGGETVLYWPDTSLVVELNAGDTLLYIGYSTTNPVGIMEMNPENIPFQLFQNFPNPVNDRTEISLYIPEQGTVKIEATDIQGRVFIAKNWYLEKGMHSFRFNPGDNKLCIFTVRWNRLNRSIKILKTHSTYNGNSSIEYTGSDIVKPYIKASLLTTDFTMQESGFPDAPIASKTHTFQFAHNIPCPGTPTVTYEGQVYNTLQVFNQCWLKENLNVGIMVPGSEEQSDNGTIEKYCYNDDPDSCAKYGGYYQWNEMMQYSTQQGTQGICPSGWHIPTDEEWNVLEGAADSQYGIGGPEWDENFYRGYDAGSNLKTTTGWYNGGDGADLFGFSCPPGGNRSFCGHFFNAELYGYFWTSSEFDVDFAWYHSLNFEFQEVNRYNDIKTSGFSVRCIRDF